MIWRAVLSSWLACATCAVALDLELPQNAIETASQNSELDSYFAPLAAYDSGILRGATIEGEVRRSVFRINSAGLTPLQVLGTLREQLETEGFDIVLDCADRDCGGFDFRFAIEVLPAPDMFVNLRNFHYVSAVVGPPSAPDRVVSLLASASTNEAYLQVIQAGDLGDEPDQFTQAVPQVVQPVSVDPTVEGGGRAEASSNIKEDFLRLGVAQLSDLQFASGSSALGTGPFSSLQALAEVMTENPNIRIAVVGHTDNVGSLEANRTLSRARASSVRRRLSEVYGIASGRMQADGVGYLAPIDTNSTEGGRNRNRRVEVILLAGAG